MIKLTWGLVRNKKFIEGVTRIYRHKLPYDVSLKVLLLTKQLDKQSKLSDEMATKLDTQYFETVEGKTQLKAGVEKEFEAEYQKFVETDFEVKTNKIDAGVLMGLQLSAEELSLLEPILTLPKEECPVVAAVPNP